MVVNGPLLQDGPPHPGRGGFPRDIPKSHTPDFRGHRFGASLDEVSGLLHGLVGIPT